MTCLVLGRIRTGKERVYDDSEEEDSGHQRQRLTALVRGLVRDASASLVVSDISALIVEIFQVTRVGQ
jgi:hypothetical protein